MRKLLLVLFLAVLLLLPSMAKVSKADVVDYFTACAWGVFPAMKASPDYDIGGGFSFFTETKMGERATLKFQYARWQFIGEGSCEDILGDFLAIEPTFWVFPLDSSRFNLHVSGGAGFSLVSDPDSSEHNLGLISGLGMMYRITHGTHLRFECSMAKYGKEKEATEEKDAFNVALGLTFAF